MRRVLAFAEILIAAAIALALACVTPRPDTTGSWRAEVVRVETSVGPTGEPMRKVTFGWQDGEAYEQATINVPFGSRTGMLRQGQRVRLMRDSLDFYRVVDVE